MKNCDKNTFPNYTSHPLTEHKPWKFPFFQPILIM